MLLLCIDIDPFKPAMMSSAFEFPSSSLTSSAYPRLDCSYSRLPCSRMPASHTRRTPRKPSCSPRRRRHSPHTRPYRWVQCCVTSIETPFLHSGLCSYAPTHCSSSFVLIPSRYWGAWGTSPTCLQRDTTGTPGSQRYTKVLH